MKKKKATRHVQTGWDQSEEIPGMFRTWAECADEITDAIIFLPGEMSDPFGFMVNSKEEMAGSTYYQALVAEHMGRCGACLAWAKGSKTLNVQAVLP